MSDALSVLLVPEADETTRQVLSTLRAAALATHDPDGPQHPDDASSTMLLRWNRSADTPVRFGDDLRPVLGDDGRVLYYESTIAEAASTGPSDASSGGLVAPLLAFIAAAERANTVAEACQAAVVAIEQVLRADRAVVILRDPVEADASLVAEAMSSSLSQATQDLLTEKAQWADVRLPRISSAVPELGTDRDALVPAVVRHAMQREGLQAALALPLLHQKLPFGMIWALYEAPQEFGVEARQVGSLLAHHLAGTLAHVRSRLASTAPDRPATPEAAAPGDSDVPTKALLGLAAAAAYGLSREPDGSLRLIWATKSLRRLLGVGADSLLHVQALWDTVPEGAQAELEDAYATIEIGSPVHVHHPMTLATGDARRIRHVVQRVRQDGRDEIRAVLIDLGPAAEVPPSEVPQATAAPPPPVDAVLLGSLGQALRDPLMTLLGQADATAEAPRLAPGDYQRAARRIASEGRRLMSTLNLIVDLARIESGEASLIRSDLPLLPELRKVVALLEPLASKREIRLEADWSGAEGIVAHQDPTALSRVLHQMVASAVAEAEPGVLHLAVHRVGGAADILLDGVRAEVPGGLGHTQRFNRVIAQRLVAQMGGALSGERRGERHRWVLSLPCVDRTGAVAATPDVQDAAAPDVQNSEARDRSGPAYDDLDRDSALVDTAQVALGDVLVAEAPSPTLPELETLFPIPSQPVHDGEALLDVEARSSTGDGRPVPQAFRSIAAAANAAWLAEEPGTPDSADQETDGGAAERPDVLPSASESTPVNDSSVPDCTDESSLPEPASMAYERTEIALPLGVRLPSSRGNRSDVAKKPGALSTPVGKVPSADLPTTEGLRAEDEPARAVGSADAAPHAFDTALDAFASVEASYVDEAPAGEPETDQSEAAKSEASDLGVSGAGGTDANDTGREARPRVLIVEDNYETRVLLERLISREFETVAVESSRAALEKLTQQQFHALVLDIHLGGRETGMDILRVARTLDGYADTFAMAVTAFGELSDRRRFLEAGFNAYVQKPFVPDSLLAPLREALHAA